LSHGICQIEAADSGTGFTSKIKYDHLVFYVQGAIMDKLKVGIIGAGWIAGHHVNGYLKSGNAEITAIADVKEQSARDLMKKRGINCAYYSDYQKLLADKNIQAVSICAPNKYHSEITVAAANAGKHILGEKPFVTNPDEAVKSYAAIKKAGVKCAVGYHRRFNPLYREMAGMRDDGKLGRLYFVQCDYIHNLPDELPIWDWIGKKSMNPSLYHAGGGHCVDTIRYIMKEEIVECSAMVSNINYPTCETEAETVALYRFASGAIGKVMSLVLKPVASFTFNLEVWGTKGTFRNNRLMLDSMPDFNDPNNKNSEIIYPEWMPNNTAGITEPWDIEVGEFVNWVSGSSDGKILCKALDAIRVAEACWAAVISSAEHRTVKLPLVNLE
jgi:predicted dehydrogenase